jgi:preprotein translocase subunit SecD
MKKNLTWKITLIVGVVVFSFLLMVLGPPSDWGDSWSIIRQKGIVAGFQQNIHLGLDLKGGTHLILQVKVEDAVKADANQAIERLKEDMRSNNISYSDISPSPNDPGLIVIKGVSPDVSGTLRSIVRDRLPEYELKSGAENSWTLSLTPQAASALKSRAVEQAIETIRNRIDQLGVTEPTIQQHGLGDYQILVQLPGVDDPARVKEIMQSTAMLDIRQALDNGRFYETEEQVLQAHNGVLPPDSEIVPGQASASQGEGPRQGYYLLTRASAVSGRDLKDASPGSNENGQPAVHFNLTREGGNRFYNFTSAHVGDYLAVVLDGRVRSVASIREPIRDSGQISGSMDDQQAKDLAMVLRSGALPAGIKYLQESTVGPSLGADSIREGVHAAIYGMAAVMIFMLVYYRFAGINANLGLILNLLILLAFMAAFKATMTLPGIAGLILTVGMGVDSNVLIFERIREELRAGKTPSQAVQQGFGHAWLTIIDTHVTTIVSAAILFLFGTGPVKGFAVTLTFGLLANLFTAVFVSRVIFDSILNRHQRGEALSI